MKKEQQQAREDKWRSQDDMNQLLDTVREMIVVVTRLDKRPTKVETLA